MVIAVSASASKVIYCHCKKGERKREFKGWERENDKRGEEMYYLNNNISFFLYIIFNDGWVSMNYGWQLLMMVGYP